MNDDLGDILRGLGNGFNDVDKSYVNNDFQFQLSIISKFHCLQKSFLSIMQSTTGKYQRITKYK